ncbi:MAG: DUF1538 family protein [Bacilli bacterium]|nr:DUF1538 family protein [Bacilli bacterium]
MGKILKEVALGVIPITIIMTVLQFAVVKLDITLYINFLTSNIFVILGIALFLFGVNTAFIPMGSDIGSSLIQKGKLSVVFIFSFAIGFAVTLPEPAVQTIITQIITISPNMSRYLLLYVTAFSVGLFILLAFLMFIFRWQFKYVVTIGYSLFFILLLLAPPTYKSMAIDIGTLTTGSLTVPFFLALGLGISAVSAKDEKSQSSYGVLVLASLGPILAILLLGVILG